MNIERTTDFWLTTGGDQATGAEPIPVGKPHPAELRSQVMIKHFTERDRFEFIPAMPSDLEAEVLISLMTTYSFSLSGSTNGKKLASLRCMWWNWCDGVHWTYVRPIQPAGRDALQRWLVSREATDERAARLRRQWFATAAEKEAARIRGAAAERKHDAIHALRVRGIDLAQEKTTLDHQLKELALRIGRGANNLDDLLDEIRKLTRRVDEIEAEGVKLDQECERINREEIE